MQREDILGVAVSGTLSTALPPVSKTGVTDHPTQSTHSGLQPTKRENVSITSGSQYRTPIWIDPTRHHERLPRRDGALLLHILVQQSAAMGKKPVTEGQDWHIHILQLRCIRTELASDTLSTHDHFPSNHVSPLYLPVGVFPKDCHPVMLRSFGSWIDEAADPHLVIPVHASQPSTGWCQQPHTRFPRNLGSWPSLHYWMYKVELPS